MPAEPIDFEISPGCDRIALCGGPYSNFGAVEAFLAQTASLPHRFCLGDIGGFGPQPNRTLDLLRQAGVVCLQGNYDYAVGAGERDCGCGYSDPRDRQFAQISYDYTYAHTAPGHRAWLHTLPPLIRLHWRDGSILLCHGSPDQVNEFVWESTTADPWITACLERYGVDGICATHTGIPWVRAVPGGFWCNVGVLGRPAHEGQPHVYFAELEFPAGCAAPVPRIVPLVYNPEPVVAAMAEAGLPQEFQDSLLSGVWTTCAEVLPEAERAVRPRQVRGETSG
ncbi:metallophosphoesterase family protein [Leptolyngbya sp. KIOST-1]|uniref:metallophosphoesterase family protein n=1 Tax=Leptolyngbya sp. KIOST-1 TaxID=1229172 RepID=UPI00068C2A74|nr:metallophosphoesterase [Leptolyngbya sp. KIOST-1]